MNTTPTNTLDELKSSLAAGLAAIIHPETPAGHVIGLGFAELRKLAGERFELAYLDGRIHTYCRTNGLD